jgi:DNA-binding response OmpR family regulator
MDNRIMIVEGNRRYGDFLVSYFRRREFQAIGFNSHGSAMASLADDLFDIALVDFFIDGTMADELCERIADRYHDYTALIIMSNNQTFENELRIRLFSPVFYLIKPFAVEDVYAVVLKIVEKREQTRLVKRMQLAAH